MQKEKHIILRKDVSSGKMYPSNELIRIVKNKDGEVFLDPTKKANGRGVYLTPTLEALKKVKEKRLLERGLKTKVNSEVFEQIKQEIESNWD